MTDLFSRRYGWILRAGITDYETAWRWQRGLVKMRREGLARDTIILLQHPPVITVGKDSHEENFSDCRLEPIFIERGGDVTYHGPGQLVGYFIFDLTRRGRDVRKFMLDLQHGIIGALDEIGIKARTDDKHTGVWCEQGKIASVGVAVKRWITFHGVAINLNTDLSEFQQINPCGLKAEQMTSALAILEKKIDLDHFGDLLVEQCRRIFVTEFEPIDLPSIAEEIESQAGGYTL
jgi:lipoate-protein ligase B